MSWLSNDRISFKGSCCGSEACFDLLDFFEETGEVRNVEDWKGSPASGYGIMDWGEVGVCDAEEKEK